MINNKATLEKRNNAKELIEKYGAYLRFSKHHNETSITCSTYVISMLARDLEVSLLEADTLQIREVLCRYYDRVKPSTLNQYRSIIISFYRFLYIDGLIDKNPATNIPVRKIPNTLPKFVEESTIDKILSHDFNETNNIEFQQKCIFELMLLCGMKCGEIASLNIYNCIITPDGISIINQNTRKHRMFPNELIQDSCIKRYINSLSQDVIELFPNYTSTSSIRNMVRSFMVKYCDLYNITPMTLRHSFAIAMINHGVRSIFVAYLLGTKVANCKSIYKYASIDTLKKAYSTSFCRK